MVRLRNGHRARVPRRALDARRRCSAAARTRSAPSPTPTCARSASAIPARCPCPTARRSRAIIKIGLALGCEIAPHSLFHRKNYFYPGHAEELPDQPVRPADLRRRPPRRRARRRRDDGASASRACTWRRTPARPRTAARRAGSTRPTHALDRLQPRRRAAGRVRDRARHALARGGRAPTSASCAPRSSRSTSATSGMEEGSLRCDANISLRPVGADGVRHQGRDQEHELGPFAGARARTSRSSGRRRRSRRGEPIVQETRHWDEDAGATEVDALEGGGVRLPVLPGARHPAARARRTRGSRRSGASLPELPRARRDRYVDGARPEARGGAGARRRPGSVDVVRAARSRWAPTPRPAANWITQDLAGAAQQAGGDGRRADPGTISPT